MPLTSISPEPVVPTPVPAPAPDYVQIPADKFAQFQAAQVELETHKRAAAYKEAEANARQLATEGRFTEITRQHEAALEAERNRTRQLAVTAELNRVLATHQLVDPSAAPQLTQLLASEFQATEGQGGLEVRSKDYRSVQDYVKDTLAKPTYQHFLAQGARQAQAAAPQAQRGQQAPPIGLPEAPQTLGLAIVLDAMNSASGAASADPRLTGGSRLEITPAGTAARVAQPSAPFGLRLPGR